MSSVVVYYDSVGLIGTQFEMFFSRPNRFSYNYFMLYVHLFCLYDCLVCIMYYKMFV